MAGMIKYLQSFRFKGLTVILGVFLAISVVLWTDSDAAVVRFKFGSL